MGTINGQHIDIRRLDAGKGDLCEAILRSLPDWFGIEEAIVDYATEIQEMPTFAALVDGHEVGIAALKVHNEFAGEIYVMGVRPGYHGQGIGSRLVAAIEQTLRSGGQRFLTVKTLSPSRPNREYELTRRFYRKVGFVPLEEFPTLWGEANPCVMMIKTLPETAG